MSLPILSQQDLYDLWQVEVQDEHSELTDFLEGSILDGLAGVYSVAGMELERYIIQQFNKTFIDLANGPEITGGPDDLQTLAVDHYGDAFARPQAVAAIDTVTFSRSTNAAGAITILDGSVVKTQPDALGNVQRYTTDGDVTLTNTSGPHDLSVSIGITAVVAGSAGDAVAGAISVIETSLLDSSIVVTNAGNATGEDAQDDATYRETIRNLLTALRAATKAAIQAAALTVPGVVVATGIEVEQAVIFWNPATEAPIGDYFLIPFPTLFIADASGNASPSLIAAVKAKIDPIRAYGVNINVSGANTVTVNWSLAITLNPSGPNYPVLSEDTSEIIQTMTSYIATLGTGISFIRSIAETAILAVWGPAGSNDLTACTTTIPTGDITIGGTQKAIPGTILTV